MKRYLSFLLLATTLLGFGLYRYLTVSERPAATTSVGSALGSGVTEGYARAYAPRPFVFPDDHGPHPDFRTEWWYITGNLVDSRGRRFGYQLTLFRIAISPTLPAVDSAWRTQQIYMGHFAVTDVTAERHHGFERFSRAAVGLAGAQANPFRVWLEDWSLTGAAQEVFPLRVQAREQGVAIELTLETAKPPVLQGESGLFQKGAEPGNASYYYSYTRLPTRGVVTVGAERFEVSGASWLDREWSTSALGSEQSGWDWFALQLDDGRELMFFRLRRKDGGVNPYSSGLLVSRDGITRRLRTEEVELDILETWTSPHTGDKYPARWRLRLPAEDMELTVIPRIADQEMRLQVRYWEGAVAVAGRSGGTQVSGQGYLEMTRYESRPSVSDSERR
jgi:predicted secreted hydrolase